MLSSRLADRDGRSQLANGSHRFRRPALRRLAFFNSSNCASNCDGSSQARPMGFIGAMASTAGSAAATRSAALTGLSTGFGDSTVVIVFGSGATARAAADGTGCRTDRCASGTTGRIGLEAVSPVSVGGKRCTPSSVGAALFGARAGPGNVSGTSRRTRTSLTSSAATDAASRGFSWGGGKTDCMEGLESERNAFLVGLSIGTSVVAETCNRSSRGAAAGTTSATGNFGIATGATTGGLAW